MFPWSKKEPVSIFEIRDDNGGKLKGYSVQKLRDALSYRLFDHKVPPTLTADVKDQWGWAYPDGVGPINVGDYLFWLVRHFKKSPPSSLINEMANEECALWLDEKNEGVKGDEKWEKVPRAVRNEIKDRLREKITRQTPPSIAESPILLDCTNSRLILFSNSDSVLDAQRSSVMKVLEEMTGQRYNATRWGFERYLLFSRPGAVMPSLVADRYMDWLVRQALSGQWCKVTAGDAEVLFSLTLGEDLQYSVGAGRYRVEGATAVVDLVEKLDDDARVQHVKLQLIRRTRGVSQKSDIHTDKYGHLRGCKLSGVDDYVAADDEWEEAVLDLGDRFVTAYETLRTLWAVFDCTEFTRLMKESPQQSMFGFAPDFPITVDWYGVDDALDEPLESTPLENAIDDMRDALGEDGEMTVTTQSGESATLKGRKK